MTADAGSLTLNGREHALPDSGRLVDLLNEVRGDRRIVAIAHNGDVVPRERYDEIVLRPGDTVEVVRMVGGG